MKNVIIIDIDSEREKKINFGKPNDFEKPVDEESAKKMILTDITCLLESLCELIHIAHENNYSSKDVLVNTSVDMLTKL